MDVRIARRLFDLRLVLATEKVNRQLIGTTGRSDIQLNVTVMLNFGFRPLPMVFEICNTGGVVLVGNKTLQSLDVNIDCGQGLLSFQRVGSVVIEKGGQCAEAENPHSTPLDKAIIVQMYTTAKEARLRADALKSELAERRTIDISFSYRDMLHDQYHDKISKHRRISANTPSSK